MNAVIKANPLSLLVDEDLLEQILGGAASKGAALFVIGKTGVGKTTLISEIQRENPDFVRAVFPGVECRKRFGVSSFADSETNSVAPRESEEFVRQIVADALTSGDLPITIVDGFPRSPDQVEWLLRMIPTDILHGFFYCGCDEEERLRRLDSRDGRDTEERRLSLRRSIEEPALLFPMIEMLWGLDCDVFPIDLTERVDERSSRSWQRIDSDAFSFVEPMTLAHMMRKHVELNDCTLSKHSITSARLYAGAQRNEALPNDLSVEWLRRYATAIKAEAEELLAELPWPWWTDDRIDLRKARVEIVDILHFLISAAIAAGMDARELFDAYEGKRQINLTRQSRLYKKLITESEKKRDDEKIGRKKDRDKPRIYLAGPIKSWPDQGWKDIFDEIADQAVFLDPLARRQRDVGPGDARMADRIEADLIDISSSDLLVAFLPCASAGASMELFYASTIANVYSIVFAPNADELSAWITEHADMVIDLASSEKDPDETMREVVQTLITDWRDQHGGQGKHQSG